MTLSNTGSTREWTDDAVRSHAFRDLVVAVAATESDTAAVETAARPIAVGLGSAVMTALLDQGPGVLHALGVHDPMPTRSHLVETLFQDPLEPRGHVGKALEEEQPVRAEVDDEWIAETWPEFAQVAGDFQLRNIAVAPFKTQGNVRGIIWVGRAEGEPGFTDEDLAFLSDASTALAIAVHAGSLQEALQRTAGRRAAVVEAPVRPGQERRRETLLSDREREILRLLALGHTNREVADELQLSTRTVEWHRARIQWKLGVSGRADLTRVAREQGV
jgi:DNA-binding CsgD family transcriptional regulator